MSTSNTGHAADAQPPTYPTLEELRSNLLPVAKSINGADRIAWVLDGPLTTAISVLKDSHSPESLVEPYFLQQTADGGGTWHPVSQLPVSEPKVSSITVQVSELEMWEGEWMASYRKETDPDVSYGPGSGVRYGALDDYDPDWDSDRSVHLLECCGQPRPRKKRSKITVKPAASGSGFVTVHDYLSTVHPWLMGLRGDIQNARSVGEDEPPSTDIMVNFNTLYSLMMSDKATWIKDQSYVFDPNLRAAYETREWPEFGPANKD